MQLAELEAEAFLVGPWRNFDDMEECISLPELTAIVDAARKVERDRQVFAAALKGIDLNKDQRDDSELLTPEERIEQAKRRVASRLSGKTEEEIEFAEFGFGIEIEEE